MLENTNTPTSERLLRSALIKQYTGEIKNILVTNAEELSDDRRRKKKEVKTGLTVCKASSFPGKAAQERRPGYSDSGAWKNTV